jgi:hypothetical protein
VKSWEKIICTKGSKTNVVIKSTKIKIKIKNKLEGNYKFFNKLKIKITLIKEIFLKKIRIKLEKTIHYKFGLEDKIQNQ